MSTAGKPPTRAAKRRRAELDDDTEAAPPAKRRRAKPAPPAQDTAVLSDAVIADAPLAAVAGGVIAAQPTEAAQAAPTAPAIMTDCVFAAAQAAEAAMPSGLVADAPAKTAAPADMRILSGVIQQLLNDCLTTDATLVERALLLRHVFHKMIDRKPPVRLERIDAQFDRLFTPFAAFVDQLGDPARGALKAIFENKFWAVLITLANEPKHAPAIADMLAATDQLNKRPGAIQLIQHVYSTGDRYSAPARGLTKLQMTGKHLVISQRPGGAPIDLSGGRFVACSIRLYGAVIVTDAVFISCHLCADEGADLSGACIIGCWK